MPIAHRSPLAALALALTIAACGSPLFTLGSALAGAVRPTGEPGRGQLVAEVIEVDEVQRRIRLTTDDGRTGTVLYDQNTQVVRDERHVTVRTLATGDVVVIQVQEEADRQLRAVRIDVQEPATAAEVQDTTSAPR